MTIDPEFRDFITRLISRGRPMPHILQILTNDTAISEFKRAFTHESIDIANNYELYEFLGDKIVNTAIGFYLKSRFPSIVSHGVLTKLFHYWSSERKMAEFAEKLNMHKYILYNSQDPKLIKEPIKVYKMKEDVFESFFGCIASLLLANGYSLGFAIDLTDGIIRTIMDPLIIKLALDAFYDSNTMINEIYSKPEQKWSAALGEGITVAESTESGDVRVAIFAWFQDGDIDKCPVPTDKNNIRKNRVKIAEILGNVKDGTTTLSDYKDQARKKALEFLATRGITWNRPNPYAYHKQDSD